MAISNSTIHSCVRSYSRKRSLFPDIHICIYVGAWIVFTVESIRGMYDPYYLVEDIRSQNQLDKSPNSWSMLMLNLQDICCLNLTGGEINLSPQDVFLPLTD